MKAEAVMKLPVGCIVDYKGSRLFIMNRYEQYNKSTETYETYYTVKFVYGKYAMGAVFEYKEDRLFGATAQFLIPKKHHTLQFEKAVLHKKEILYIVLNPRVVLQEEKIRSLELDADTEKAVLKIVQEV